MKILSLGSSFFSKRVKTPKRSRLDGRRRKTRMRRRRGRKPTNRKPTTTSTSTSRWRFRSFDARSQRRLERAAAPRNAVGPTNDERLILSFFFCFNFCVIGFVSINIFGSRYSGKLPVLLVGHSDFLCICEPDFQTSPQKIGS